MKTYLMTTLLAMALTVPALARSGGNPGGRTSGLPGVSNRPAAPVGTGRQVPLTDSYSILDDNSTSIFSINRGVALPPPPGGTGPVGGRGSTVPVVMPVFRASLVDDLGPLALLEVPDNRGALTNVYLRPGATWNNYKVVSISLDTLRLSRTGIATDIAIGHNLDGQQVGALPSSPGYLAADSVGTSSPTPGAPGGLRMGGRSAGNIRGSMAVAPGPLSPGTLVNPALDPPLPAGSSDDIASRMAARRLNQLNATGGSAASTPP